MRNAASLSLAAVWLVLGQVATANAQQPAEAAALRTVSTTGEATVYVMPDEVLVTVGVESSDADIAKARSENQRLSAQLLKAIRESGVEEKDIQTATLELEPVYHHDDRSGSRVLVGFLARQAYAVTLKQPKQLADFMEMAVKNGANRVTGFEFRTPESRKYRDQARIMAVRAAREKAVALAQELGCGIGAPRTIEEQYTSAWGRSLSNSNNVLYSDPREGGESATPLGQIAMRARVAVSFDLVPDAAASGKQ